jgi:hypothetical protein
MNGERMAHIPLKLQKRFKIWLGLGLIIGTLGIMYHHSLAMHIKRAANPWCFYGDALSQISALFRYHDKALFPNGYIIDHYLAAFLPNGYKALYAIGSKLLDPTVISKALPYGLLLILLISLGFAAGKFGGLPAAWGAMALALSAGLFLRSMGGGLPRAFAFPIFACATAAIIYGRMYLLAILVCLGAAFYPMAAVPPGITLAIILLFMPARDRGEASGWSFRRRMVVLVGTGLLSMLIVLPTIVRSRPYGPRIKPSEISAYPEAGPSGRYRMQYSVGPHKKSHPSAFLYSGMKPFIGKGKRWSKRLRSWFNEGRPTTDEGPGRRRYSPRQKVIQKIIYGIILIGFVWLSMHEPAARRLLALTLAVFIGYEASIIFQPYLFLPLRYVDYPAPVLTTIMFPSAASALPEMLRRFARQQWLKMASTLTLCIIVLALLGGRGLTKAGLGWCASPKTQMITKFIGSLPADVLIAGWPTGFEMNSVQYLSKRRVFVTHRTHLVFYKGYVEEMRKRTRALIDAYYATNIEPLIRLRDEFGVTHLFVITKDIHPKVSARWYFAPFDQWAKTAHAQARKEGFELRRQFTVAGIFSGKNYVILDLSKLKGKNRGK